MLFHTTVEFKAIYDLASTSGSTGYEFNPQEVGRRRLRNTCLDYLAALDNKEFVQLAKNQFDSANCMTDKISSFAVLASKEKFSEREEAIEQFHRDANNNALVLNKWFTIQALADYPGVLDNVKNLKEHKDFLLTNPNRARALISAFTMNLPHFHRIDGAGYSFLADCIIELDPLNPQVAARMAGSFSQWKKFDNKRKDLMQKELKRILDSGKLSPDLYEVVNRCLN